MLNIFPASATVHTGHIDQAVSPSCYFCLPHILWYLSSVKYQDKQDDDRQDYHTRYHTWSTYYLVSIFKILPVQSDLEIIGVSFNEMW